jgi:hypothetical protein
MWVLDALAKGFHTYYKGQGQKALADVLGLNLGPGKSQFKQSAIDELHQQLALEIYRLKICFSLSVADAAAMLEGKFRHHPVVNNTRWRALGRNYNADTFTKKYSRWRDHAHLDEKDLNNPFHPDYKERPWSEDRRRAFLLSFPRESWPRQDKWHPRLSSIL